MARWDERAVIHQIHRLYAAGSVAGLSERQLLERFLGRGDEAAFAALVARHGPMVLGVCRRLLSDSHDVEDAFQATFLVLVRKAGTLREQELLGHWLHAVAHRIALRARANANRRRAKERPAIELGDAIPSRWEDREDLKEVIDGEVRRLPERYRSPIVLCYLEGHSNEEAARQLGCPVGTVRSRLARGRDRLRVRLTRLGFAPSAALLESVLSPGDARAAVPRPLIETTVLEALAFGAGKTAALGIVPASVHILAEGALTTMFLTKLKLTAAGALLLGSLAAGALGQSNAPEPSQPAPPTSAAANPIPPARGPLQDVESKLDRLLKVLEAQQRTPTSAEPGSAAARQPAPTMTLKGEGARIIQHEIVAQPVKPGDSPRVLEHVIIERTDRPVTTTQAEERSTSQTRSYGPYGLPTQTPPELPAGRSVEAQGGARQQEKAVFIDLAPSDSERLARIEQRLGRMEKALSQVQALLEEKKVAPDTGLEAK